MQWFWMSLCLCVVLAFLNRRKTQCLAAKQHAKELAIASQKHVVSALHDVDEWQQIIRDVQRHMHVLCVYREAIRERIDKETSILLSSMEERLVCEIADHMTLVNRAHRLLNEPVTSRKQTDPALILKSMRQRCVDSENLCTYIADELHLYLSVAALDAEPNSVTSIS